MKVNEALKEAASELNINSIEEPISKARRLLAFVLKVPKEYLIINNSKEITEMQHLELKQHIMELIQGKPIQYILHEQEFMGIMLEVNEKVLIPQPDTEILVEETIKCARQFKKPKILDLCTGSGAIAISISKYVPQAKIIATDISQEALEIAKMNDKENRIKFIQSDLFENINSKFDIIVSNPPYIKTEEIKQLSKEVQNEPLLALDGGKDGLHFYRKIIGQAVDHLDENGYLCIEIGEDQKKEIMQILKQNGRYSNTKVYKDLQKNDRVITCKKK